MPDTSFKDFILDQLCDIDTLRAQPMFGGWGLYSNTVFFGIISGGVTYLKTNKKSREKYIEYGSGPFQPNKKQTLKKYYEVPADVLENRELFTKWARRAIEI